MNSAAIIGRGWVGSALDLFLKNKGFTVWCTQRDGSDFSFQLGKAFPNTLLTLQPKVFICTIPPNDSRYAIDLCAMLAEIKEFCPQARFIFLSTTGVYEKGDQPITETGKITPQRKSAVWMYEAENAVRESMPLQSWTILRLAGLAGPGREPGSFLSGRINCEDPEGRINFVHLDDVLEVIFRCIENPEFTGIWNVCSDEHPSREKFFQHRALMHNWPPPHFVQGQNSRKEGYISAEKLKIQLSYHFIHPNPLDFPSGN
jgi:nucleoside-diphosphate-sugar epimerase